LGGTRYVFFLFYKAMISISGERDSRERSVVIFEEKWMRSIGVKESIILSKSFALNSAWPCCTRFRYWWYFWRPVWISSIFSLLA
jgi:hypothetical protein